jgi:hypothetical protein
VPRFVILRHDPEPVGNRKLHWDLMLEEESSLLTWALEYEPEVDISIPAEQLANHRLEYLDYEGPVSGNRGTVSRWDSGSYEWTGRSDVELRLDIEGQVLAAQVCLRRTAANTQRWVVLFSAPDSLARR